MPKVKSRNHYGERHSLYETTSTSEEKAKSTNDKIRILLAMELNEPYRHAVVISEGVKKYK